MHKNEVRLIHNLLNQSTGSSSRSFSLWHWPGKSSPPELERVLPTGTGASVFYSHYPCERPAQGELGLSIHEIWMRPTPSSSSHNLIQALLINHMHSEIGIVIVFLFSSQASPMSLSTLNNGWNYWGKVLLFQWKLLSWKYKSLELLLPSFSKT